jgi:hypothetical protein
VILSFPGAREEPNPTVPHYFKQDYYFGLKMFNSKIWAVQFAALD